MKQVFASCGLGVLLLVVWGCIIVLTSQDFAHEGPNSVWAAPIHWWGGVMQRSGISRALRASGPTIFPVVGFSVLFAPFIALFSCISFFVLRLWRNMRRKRNLSDE